MGWRVYEPVRIELSEPSYAVSDFKEHPGWYRKVIRNYYPEMSLNEAVLRAWYLLVSNLCYSVAYEDRRKYLKKGLANFIRTLFGPGIYNALSPETLEEMESFYYSRPEDPPSDLTYDIKTMADEMVRSLGVPADHANSINRIRRQDEIL